jgi:hypothetical protein
VNRERDASLYDSLDGQVALVTGANRGIGEAVAGRLAERGATVYAGTRDEDEVTATDRRPVRLDVTDEAEVAAAVDRVEAEAGRLDVLVNNAAVYGPAGPWGELDPEAVTETVAVDLTGPALLCRAALPLLTDRPGGRIVNVSSGAGQFAGGLSTGHGPYAVSKAGLNALTRVLAGQYPDLLVNAVCPGWVRTDMGGAGAPRSVAAGADTPAWLARFRPESPSGLFWRDRSVIEW